MEQNKALGKAGSFTLLVTACLTIMVGAAIAPGVQSVAHGLGLKADASWLITLPSLGVVLFGPFAARLIVRLGSYRNLLAGLFFYGLLGAGGFFAHGVFIFADRLLLGAATVLVMAAGTALISENFHGPARLRMIALQGMAIECAGVVFLFVSGHLAALAWGLPFLLYLLGWLVLGLVWLFIPNQPLTHKNTTVHSKDNRDAIEQTQSGVREIFAAALISLAVFFITVMMLPRHLASFGYSESDAGSFLAFVSLVAVCAAALMPRFTRTIGEVATLSCAFVFYALGYLGFASGTAFWVFVVACIFVGMAFGLSVPLVNHMMIECSRERQRARNLTYLSVFIFLGQFLSSFIAMVSNNPAVIFMVGAGLSALAAVFFIFRKSFQTTAQS